MKSMMNFIMNLNTNELKNCSLDSIPPENHSLVFKLILTSIRHYCSRIIRNSPGKTISEIAITYMKNLTEFKNIVTQFNPKLNDEIQTLIFSVLLLHFPKGLSDLQSDDIDELKYLDEETYDAFSFCGLSKRLRSLIVDQIRSECLKTVEEYTDNYEESALSAALDRLSILNATFQKRFPDISQEKHNLERDIYKAVVKARSNMIFEIVTSYPDSKPALIDLQKGCARTSAHREVSQIAVQIFTNRLLHLGAATSDIVTQYINAIQALNIVDESGGLTRAVSPPIQSYLTTRSDLLDTIVERILEDESLVATGISAQKPNDDDVLRDADAQKELDFGWSPEPMHSHIRDLQSLVRDASDSDALALLLNVYGSIKSFVTQLEKEIAKRIETSPGFTFDNEVRAIELLKWRFGSQSFLNCEVILRDVADSKRLAATFDCQTVQPLTVSHLYWPAMSNDFLKLPEEVEREIERYTEEFERLKHPRKLKWLNSAGAVEIELSFDDNETMQMTVPPICASVMLLMNDNNEIDIDTICNELEVSRQSAETALTFWISSNIFVKDGNKCRMVNKKPILTATSYDTPEGNNDEEEEPEEEEEEPDQKDAKMFQRFVLSILQNRSKENITLPNLYELLKKFCQYPKFDRRYDQYEKMINVYKANNFLVVEDEIVKLSPQ
ncbi:hypothetical protein TRFO_05675 [Tritrichomonas foetus]|uniref:Cullin family profile domain-containing protein n=1 Tax=Tritrichomonas foetus TaxID=1144522 RepID=A0A1J4K4Y0_9EUKA|nr:hypothetical protein TRFO_05675 [Tritrichomonas foetus]|eukprot:OHT06034.1 hypothetical protein TRFO_05675 [Tritrichomonas foetus]